MEDNGVQEITNFYAQVINTSHKLRSTLTKYPDLPKDLISEKHDQISDLILFIVIVQTDIAICCKHLLINKQLKDYYEMNYFARVLATHCSDIYKNDEGRILYKINKVAEVYKNEDGELKNLAIKLFSSRTKLHNIGKDNINFIADIRNNLFAHRDGTGIAQNVNIDNIDTSKIVHIVADMDDILGIIIKDLLAIQQLVASLTLKK